MTIKRVTLNDPEAQSADPVADNVAALKTLFPAAVADGRIDFDTLRQLLGDEVDDGDERYGLNWPGKRRARRLALTPSTGTLRPAREDSVDWNTTRNLMIEGDNLEVLKLLQKSYAGAVNLIYIDPPYNTGSDFVYPDDYTDGLASYLKMTEQKDEKGITSTSNPQSSGRFHSRWLSMIYPRLLLSRYILSNDGAIFISCDEGEQANLRLALEEVFGAENFIANIIWQKKFARQNDAAFFSTMHDFIICVAKVSDTNREESWRLRLLQRSIDSNTGYANPDNDSRGEWASVVLSTKSGSSSLVYDIVTPSGRVCRPPEGRYWAYSQEKLQMMISDNRIWFGKQGSGVPRLKTFLSEVQDGLRPNTMWFHEEVSHNQEARQSLKALFDGEAVFDSPKPLDLLKQVLSIGSDKSAVVLDFFAGSGSLGHAVMDQNASDGGDRRYILVQLPEPLDPKNKDQQSAAAFCDKIRKPRNIAELTKERLRRAAKKVIAENADTSVDLGFRVYKLSTSNFRSWEPGEDLAADLLAAADNIVQDRTEDDLLTELLLKQGIDLTEPMVTETIAGAPVNAMGGGVLVVCLAPVTAASAEALADGIADWIERLNPVSAATIFFKDAGFENDVAKANIAAILAQRLDDKLLKVRSL